MCAEERRKWGWGRLACPASLQGGSGEPNSQSGMRTQVASTQVWSVVSKAKGVFININLDT